MSQVEDMREACAAIADVQFSANADARGQDRFLKGWRLAAREIARMIRALPTPVAPPSDQGEVTYRRGLEACAAHMEAKAAEMRGSPTGDMMARIFEGEAAEFRSLKPEAIEGEGA